MFKKIISINLILLSFFLFSPLGMAHQYEDVPQESSNYYPIDYLRRNNVFKDTEFFHPDILISKAEFIKYLVRLNNPNFKTKGKVELPFSDTRNNAWYAPYFKEAIKLGILDKREEKAEPNKKLTLTEALKLTFHSQSIPIPNVYKGSIPYNDVKRNKSVAPLIMRALSLGIISPQRKDYVGIYKRITRAEAAKIIYNMDLVTLGSAYSNDLPNLEKHSSELNKIITTWEIIEDYYLRTNVLDKEKMTDDVLEVMTESLSDPYSNYMNTEENKGFFDSLSGNLEGIGAVIGFNDKDELSIVSPIKDSPAEKAGLIAKDVILEVDDVDISDLSLMEAVGLIKGPRGTMVKLKIRRNDKNKIIQIKRDVIVIPSVEYERIENGKILLISIRQFNDDLSSEFNKALEAIDENVKGIIIDLRGNPGGYLNEAVNILGHFVEARKNLVIIRYRDYEQILLSNGNAELSKFPLTVLIDNGSASASEIVAGALKDYELAKIIGETSFGKGTVQNVINLANESSIKLTIAEWLTPNKNSIQSEGIEPDIKIKDNPDTEVDEVINTAIKELKKEF